MTCTAGNALLLDSQAVCLPMPPVTLAPTVWFLGAHMLKCLQDAALKKPAEIRSKGRKSPQLKTADKSTQTVSSYAQKHAQERKTPTRSGSGRRDGRETASAELRKQPRESRKSLCETNPSSGNVSGKSPHHSRRRSEDRSSNKSEATAVAAEQRNVSSSSFFTQSRPTKDGAQMSRRVSTGDCPKRTSTFADLKGAKWLENPVYASDGESDGRRTDRSEMSPPWFDISVAQMKKSDSTVGAADPRAVARNLVKPKKKHVQAISRSTQPNMEAVPESTAQPSKSRERKSTAATRPVAQCHVNATDPSILRLIEKKLGKPLSELDTASLKTLSEERMKELKAKYAGHGLRPSPARKE